MAKNRFYMIDWQHGPKGEKPADVDNRLWSTMVETARDSITIKATAPDGSEREIWIEIADGYLVAHCYDPAHEEPLNVRIGADSIKTDDDREREGIFHG